MNMSFNTPENQITEVEYWNWFTTSEIIEPEHATFTSCCGPHDFAQRIEKNGIVYELSWGCYPENKEIVTWYAIKELYKEVGQEGEGI